jgi:4'-phosphopantetheinyl transferase
MDRLDPPEAMPFSGEAHLWCGDPTELAPDRAYASALQLLSDDERQRLERLHFARDRVVFLATRTLVRRVLSRYGSLEPAAWRFAVNAHGRPEIANLDSPIRFNLSNTHRLVVCVLTCYADIGVDVEQLGDAPPLEVVEHFFAPKEVAALRALPERERTRRFFDYWTLKESYIKARGLGMAIPLDRFAFILDERCAPRIEIDAELGDAADQWRFMQVRPTPEHLVAVCVRSTAGPPVTRLRWQPLAS